jgi:hypothetical protein
MGSTRPWLCGITLVWLNLLPDLVWKQGTPAGDRVGGDGSVERTDFVAMSRHLRGEEN